MQGGDWGGIIATTIGQLDSTRCLGLHLNFFPLVPTPWMALVGRHFLSSEDNDKAGFPPQKLLGTMMVSIRGWLGERCGRKEQDMHQRGAPGPVPTVPSHGPCPCPCVPACPNVWWLTEHQRLHA